MKHLPILRMGESYESGDKELLRRVNGVPNKEFAHSLTPSLQRAYRNGIERTFSDYDLR
jgi:hypothetical protein